MKIKLPFTAGEWDAVRWAAGAVTEAAQADDGPAGRPVRRPAGHPGRAAGPARGPPAAVGDRGRLHPDARGRGRVVPAGRGGAVAANWPTLSIRLSLAHVLAEELDLRAEARDALLACRDELPWSLEADCVAWATLLAACPPDLPAGLAGSKWGTGRTVAVGGAK